MEERREIVYSDISSPSRKQPYDAMVYIDGTSVIAVDSTGRKIAEGTAGTDDATVIQAAVTAAEKGDVVIRSSTTAYVIDTTITVPYRINILGTNTNLDVSPLNATVFDFDPGCVAPASVKYDPYAFQQKISGFKIVGAGTNSSTLFAHFKRNPGGVVCENLFMSGVNNGVKIEGECYLATVRNVAVISDIENGIPIHITQGSGSYGANGILIDHCWVEPDTGLDTGVTYPISIDNASDVQINNTWVEGRAQNNIYLNACVDVWINNMHNNSTGNLNVVASNLHINNARMTGVSVKLNGGQVWMNNVDATPGARPLVDIIGASDAVNIVNSIIILYNGHAVVRNISQTLDSLNVSKNVITAMSQVGDHTEKPFDLRSGSSNATATISDNTLYGLGTGGTSSGDICVLKSSAGILANNIFYNINANTTGNLINSAGNFRISGNRFASCVGLFATTASDTIADNIGYTTESKGTATLLNTTTSTVVAHGCSATPTNITVTPGAIGNATKWYVDTIGATNFTIHVDADPGADITFYWRAEV